MIPQGLAGPSRSSQCAESCLEMLSMEVVHYYARQDLVPAAAAIEQIGALVAQELNVHYFPRTVHGQLCNCAGFRLDASL